MNNSVCRRCGISGLLVAAVLTLGQSVSLAPAQGSLTRLGLSQLTESRVEVAWQVKLPTGYGRRIGGVLPGRENVYFITRDGVIYCLSLRDGRMQWVYLTGYDFDMIAGFAEQGGSAQGGPIKHLYITMVSRVLVLDISTGKLVARLELPGGAGGAAAGDGVNVYAGSANGRLYAIDIDSGSVLWQINSPGPILEPVLYGGGRIYYVAGGSLCGAPVKQSTLDAQLSALKRLPASINTLLSRGRKLIYVCCNFGHTGKLSAMSQDLSSTAWYRPTLGPISGPAVEVGDRVYQELDGMGVLCLKADNGGFVWKCDAGRKFLADDMSENVLLLGRKCLLVVSRTDGKVKLQVTLAGKFQALPAGQGKQAILLGDRSGEVICLQGTAGPGAN